jgi:hypothetical protein
MNSDSGPFCRSIVSAGLSVDGGKRGGGGEEKETKKWERRTRVGFFKSETEHS